MVSLFFIWVETNNKKLQSFIEMQKREKGDDSLANNYIADSVIGAIDTVIKGAIRDLKYDQTIEAIVTSSDKAADGVYTVKSETASFEAYSSNRYYVNDTVYVMIPQGDFNKQKFITGRKVDQVSTETTFTLKLPFDDFIGLQDLTEGFNFPEEELGYIANHGHPNAQSGLIDLISNEQRHGSILTAEEQKNEDIVGTYRQTNLIGHWVRKDKAPVLTTKLAVSFDVRSLLHDYRPLYGQYGIRLLVTGRTQTTETTSSEIVTQDIYFTNKDMYGDTYAYFVETTQQKIFDISSLISLEEIEIYFWQDFDFQDEQRVLIPWEDEFRGVVPPNLFLSNFNVYLGLTTDDINDERVFLYTYGDVKYGYEPEVLTNREKLDTRTLEFAWVHHDYIEEKFILVNTPEKLANYNAKIFWYQLEYDVKPTEEEAGELYWRLAPENWKYLPEYNNQFQIQVCPSIAKSKEKYMAIVSFDGTFEKSEALTFTNIIDVDSLNEALAANKNYIFKFYRPATEAEKALHAGNEDNVFAYGSKNGDWLIEDDTIGNFFVYDENNRVLKNEDEIRYSDIEYYAILHLLTRETNKEGEEYEYYSALYGDTESGFDSQIVFPENFSMITQVPMSAQDPYFINHWESGNLYDKTICKFKINYFWDLNYRDNTLSATVTRHGNTYYINKEMLFGQSGSQGSEYTIRMQLESMSNYAIIKGNSFSVGAYVYDRNGRMLTPEDDGSKTMLFAWELLGPSRVTSEATSGADGSWTTKDSSNFSNNIITGYVRNDYPPIFRVTVTGAADYPITATKGFIMTNGLPSLVQQYTVMCPNRVEYKSDGSAPIYDTSEFIIESINGDKIYPEWELIQLKDGVNTNEYFTLKETEYTEVTIPTNAGEKRRPTYIGYKLISNIGDGTSLDPIPHYWDPAMATSCYMCLSANMTEVADNGTQQIYIRQAIPFEHNIYASSLINSWDGSLTLDNENGAILSTMMSAGTKDNQNKFTGVIMGDWAEKGDSSLDTPGLYGFTKGEQTFGFKTDGTGFIGKASAGQIQFDGNQALISSADKNFYLNLNPIRYSLTDLGDFSLNSFNQYSYSPYFLYAKTPKTSDVWGEFSNFVDPDQNLTSWTEPFFNDSENDYFVVDPNNGILTTGGVIAKYGKIGNWMISDNGLYQRLDSKDTDISSRYMYLGFPSAETNDALKALKIIYDQKYLDAYLKYLDELNALTVNYYPQIYEYEPIHYYNYSRDLKMAYDVLVVTLDQYNKNGGNLRSILEANMAEMITDDFIDNFDHQHYYSNGRAYTDQVSPKGNMYTGNRYRVYDFLGYQPRLETYTVQLTYYNEDGTVKRGYPQAYTRYKAMLANNYQRRTGTSYTGTNAYTGSNATRTIESIGTSNKYHPDNTKVQNMQMTINGKASWLNTITTEQMEYLIQLWPTYFQNGLDGYLYQLDQQRQAGYSYVPYEERKAVEDAYALAKGEIDSAYAAEKRALQNADTDRYAIFAGEEVDTNPIFYVKWNGDMFARRGLIANTWVIDDHSLTYQKNSDIMYIGTEEYTQIDGTKWYPNGRVYAGTDDNGDPVLLDGEERKWAISASDSYSEEETYPINFGVSLSGELYAQLGTIGGWSITKDYLYAEQRDETGAKIGFIIIDAKNNQMNFNDSTILKGDGTIVLGAPGEDGSTTGSLFIAGFNFLGSTKEKINYPVVTYSDGKAYETVNIDVNKTTWGSANKIIYQATLSAAQNKNVSINNLNFEATNTLGILDATENGNSVGLMMSVGHLEETDADYDKEQDGLLTLYPSSTTKKGILGLPATTSRWDIYANIIDCKDLQLGNGNLSAGSVYISNEKAATEPWVYNQLVDIYGKLDTLSNSTSGASGRASGAHGIATGAINLLGKALQKLAEYDFVTAIDYKRGLLVGKVLDFQMLYEDIMNTEDTTTGGSGSTDAILDDNVSLTIDGAINAGTVPWSLVGGVFGSASTADVIEGSAVAEFEGSINSSNKLSMSIKSARGAGDSSYGVWTSVSLNGGFLGLGGGISLSHTHQPTFTFSEGTVSCEIGDANFSQTSLSDSFDVSSTDWYKARAYYTYQPSVADNGILIKAQDSTNLATIKPTLTLSGSKAEAVIQCNIGTTTILSYALKDFYNSAKADGTSAVTSITNYAKSGLSYSDGGSYDITVSASGGSVTAYAHAAGGNRKCKFNISVKSATT